MSAILTAEDIKSRYTKMEREADVAGRVIGVRRLRPSQKGAVDEMTPGMTGTARLVDADGKEVEVTERVRYYICAAVREIDDKQIPFPRSRAELNAIVDELDDEGFAAASVAMSRLFPSTEAAQPGADAAKN